MKRKRDYQRKQLTNPYFDRQKKSRIRFRTALVIIFFIVLLGLGYISWSAPTEISGVTVVGAELVDQRQVEAVAMDQMESRRFFFFPQQNLFFFNGSDLEAKLLEQFPFEDVDVDRNFFTGQLTIMVTETPFLLVWVSGETRYYLDEEGMAVQPVKLTENVVSGNDQGGGIIRLDPVSRHYPTVIDRSGRPVTLETQALSPQKVAFVSQLSRAVRLTNFSIARFEIIAPSADEIEMVTTEGWLVRLSLAAPLEPQLARLLTVLEKRIDDRTKLEYIDLRFGEKVFYK